MRPVYFWAVSLSNQMDRNQPIRGIPAKDDANSTRLRHLARVQLISKSFAETEKSLESIALSYSKGSPIKIDSRGGFENEPSEILAKPTSRLMSRLAEKSSEKGKIVSARSRPPPAPSGTANQQISAPKSTPSENERRRLKSSKAAVLWTSREHQAKVNYF